MSSVLLRWRNTCHSKVIWVQGWGFLNAAIKKKKILKWFFYTFDQTVVIFQSWRSHICIKEQMLDILFIHKLSEIYIEEKHISGIEHGNTSNVE